MTSDAASRQAAVDPSRNIVLEASAGTGKTRVLVERYANLLRAGVDPDHVLAITFTRKAANEMRQRIVARLREASRTSELDAARWRVLRSRLGDITISTIDAFCLSLLREFPLEAGIDPGFEMADETEVPRLIEESLDSALRIARARAREDEDVALVFALLGERRLRAGLASLLDRRLVAPEVMRRFLANGPRDLTASRICEEAAARLRDLFTSGGDVDGFLKDGPVGQPSFQMVADDIRSLGGQAPVNAAAFRALVDRLRGYFLTQQGEPRKVAFTGTGYTAADCASIAAWKRHRERAAAIAPAFAEIVRRFRRDLNAVMARGVWRVFGLAVAMYRRTLESRARLDFASVLERALDLMRQMDEFAQSRYRLEARYHHVLVDELQDTSRAQWELVSQLVRSWGEGLGASADALPPSIFVVGDRKQSIYGFRDAEVSLLDDAAAFVSSLRPAGGVRHAISTSFRSTPALLAFVNDLFAEIVESHDGARSRSDRFRYDDTDRFPVDRESADRLDVFPQLGIVVGEGTRKAAEAVAAEIVALLDGAMVRDRQTGIARRAAPADVAILFRSRDNHRDFEGALEARGIPTYVYKGLGFFEAPEIQDAVALLRYLADPASDLRAAALLRSRLIRLSDAGVVAIAPAIAAALGGAEPPDALSLLGLEDRGVLIRARAAVAEWTALVDRVTPSELLDRILAETAYAYELRGVRRLQARENLKKLRALVRRSQNRGYQTLARIAEHLDRLAVGDESNAAIDAIDAVSLMTVHAAKGLEFPIVFVVNIGRGTGGVRPPIRVSADAQGGSVAIADYQSDADEDAQARDREETKRLLYVALTRARDRLYLSAALKDGVCKPGRGSLGEVLPASAVALFEQAAAGGELVWASAASSEGRRHVLAARSVHRPEHV